MSQPRSEPTGAGLVVIGSYDTYAEAERAVDYLSDQRFPVERTAIAGRGLSTFEQVTGRLTAWRAAGQAALSGAVLGALFGWLFGLFDWINPLISGLLLALYGAIFGAVIGAVVGLIGYAMTGGRRDFSSVPSMRAERYEVLVDATDAAHAAQLLDAPGAPGRGRARTA
ncbi:MAG: glycine zipper family protein [Saccharothrix sp.]|nr:glycine zipper family protein [Saccharothrix sp.]